MDSRLNNLKKENKVQDVRIYEEEKNEYVDDWKNEEYIDKKTQVEDELFKELEEKSRKLKEGILASKKHFKTFEEPLNEEPVKQVQLRKTKIDFVLLGAIFAFIMLFWLIFLRQ